ncbi:hypothetical protein [Pseudomonas sp. IT-P176]|jgi:hypothetical protein|uniref:hypothetical protein n=1 Tax=Pseudomonas sp. IT-P176 TaxID=3026444 RepID=UPI0039DFED70
MHHDSNADAPHIDLSIEEFDKPPKHMGEVSLKPYEPQPSESDYKVTDWSTESTTEVPGLTDITTRPYDSRPHDDHARRLLAYSLVLLLALVTLGAMTLFVIPGTDQEALKNLLNQILGPLVALVSAATGFYFATKRE